MKRIALVLAVVIILGLGVNSKVSAAVMYTDEYLGVTALLCTDLETGTYKLEGVTERSYVEIIKQDNEIVPIMFEQEEEVYIDIKETVTIFLYDVILEEVEQIDKEQYIEITKYFTTYKNVEKGLYKLVNLDEGYVEVVENGEELGVFVGKSNRYIELKEKSDIRVRRVVVRKVEEIKEELKEEVEEGVHIAGKTIKQGVYKFRATDKHYQAVIVKFKTLEVGHIEIEGVYTVNQGEELELEIEEGEVIQVVLAEGVRN